jgi:hypothetical protein
MTTGDKTERAVQELARKQNGNAKTAADLYELILAVNEDGESRHEETLGRIRKLEATFREHCAEGDQRDRRLDILEGRLDHCPATVTAAIEAADDAHLAFHNKHLSEDHEPRRATDPDGADFSERRFTKAQIVGNFWVLIGVVALNTAVTFSVLYVLERFFK